MNEFDISGKIINGLGVPALVALGSYVVQIFTDSYPPLSSFVFALLGGFYLLFALDWNLRINLKEKGSWLKIDFPRSARLLSFVIACCFGAIIFITTERAEQCVAGKEIKLLADTIDSQRKHISELQDSLQHNQQETKPVIVLPGNVIKSPPAPASPCGNSMTHGQVHANGEEGGFIMKYEGIVLDTTDNFGRYDFNHCKKGVGVKCGEKILVTFTKGSMQKTDAVILCLPSQTNKFYLNE